MNNKYFAQLTTNTLKAFVSCNTKRILCAISLLLFSFSINAQTQLVKNLENGANQKIVFYGTSLTVSRHWSDKLVNTLKAKYGNNKITAIHSGMSGEASNVGVQQLQNRVLQHNPDTVFIEFSANDSNGGYRIPPQQANANLTNMINRILAQNPNAEIILQSMNSAWGRQGQIRPRYDEYIQGYRDIARTRNLLLVDHYPNWVAIQKNNLALFKKYLPDMLHPTKEAYQNVVDPVLEKAIFQGVSTNPNLSPLPPSNGNRCSSTQECKTKTGVSDSWCNVWLGNQPAVCYCGGRGECKTSTNNTGTSTGVNVNEPCQNANQCQDRTGKNYAWCNIWENGFPKNVCRCGGRACTPADYE